MKQKTGRKAHGCLQALAVPLVIIFVLVTVPITLIASFSATVTSRTTVKAMIDLDPFVRTFMVQSIEADIYYSYVEHGYTPPELDSRNLYRAVDLLVPNWWVDEAVNSGVDTIYDFLENGRTDDYLLDYTPIVQSFQSEAGLEAMTLITGYYPICPASVAPQFEYVERNIEISCLPADRSVIDVGAEIHQRLLAGFQADPSINMNGGAERVPWSPTILAQSAEIRQAFHIVEQLQLLWLVPLTLLILIALFAVRSWSTLAGWIGIPLLLTGFLTAVAGLMVYFQYSELAYSLLAQFGVPEELLGKLAYALVENALLTLGGVWFFGILLQAFLMGLFGVGCFIVVFWAWRNGKKTKSASSILEH